MALKLDNLDEQTRALMLDEVGSDIVTGRLYLSKRFSAAGRTEYPELLRQAAAQYDETWLAARLREDGRIALTEQRAKPGGGSSTVKVPVTAADTLAEGEFNRFYIRGLCRRAEQEGIRSLTVYRAKEVDNPRAESQAKIGATVSALSLLNDLRANPGVDTALGLPSGPNSGLSVKLP